ncbi:MAG: helix-turn-helix domain-containing protein, partial [Balneolaceae bacterium]|nr:helix-turn-helix domain-containing protein [Balneolaceae bacterium]
YSVGYLGFFKPEYLQEAHSLDGRYEHSSLTEEDAGRYLDQLLEYMADQKPYLDGKLRMDDLAEELSIPSHHLSQIINEQLGKNFFEFVNAYRVNEARKLLSDPEKREYKILRIALESGFNNKTTFNNAFKSEVGTTPSSFRNSVLNGKELSQGER